MSPNGWKEATLNDIAYLNYGKSLTADARKKGSIPVYSSSGITGQHDRALVDEEGIIIGRKGNVGSVFYSKQPFYCIDTAYYIKKSDLKCDIKYLYYLLKTLRLERLNEDSAVPGLNRDTALSQTFDYPESIETQRRIAEILSALDDKIELNRQTNATLEAIAQAIFKEWFVNFNFPGATGELVESELGMIPKGWKILPMDKIADFLNGLALQNYPAENDYDYLPVIKIREMKNGITDSSDKASKNLPAKYIVHDGDLLFSWSGSLEIIFWVGGDGALNQHLFKVTSNNYPIWFCYFWILQYIDKFKGIAEDKTTTMGHIQRHHISEAICLIPDKLENIDKVMNPIIEKIINNQKEVILLAKIRDALLPKLMSGEIEL
ncbi:MAG: restriction endonuclease subunit S [Anaerolineaceae bacterium]